MRSGDCQFHGRHRFRLTLLEECEGCGHRRSRRPVSRWGLWAVPLALWANALLLACLVLG